MKQLKNYLIESSTWYDGFSIFLFALEKFFLDCYSYAAATHKQVIQTWKMSFSDTNCWHKMQNCCLMLCFSSIKEKCIALNSPQIYVCLTGYCKKIDSKVAMSVQWYNKLSIKSQTWISFSKFSKLCTTFNIVDKFHLYITASFGVS